MAQNARLYGSFCTEVDFTNSADSFDEMSPSPRSTVSSSEYEHGYDVSPYPELTAHSKPPQPLQVLSSPPWCPPDFAISPCNYSYAK